MAVCSSSASLTPPENLGCDFSDLNADADDHVNQLADRSQSHFEDLHEIDFAFPTRKLLEVQSSLILHPTLKIEQFRNACWFGIENALRPMAWKLLLGYLPRNTLWRVQSIINKRRKYSFCLEQYYNQKCSRTLHEQAILTQIEKDIPRVCHGPLLKNSRIQLMMTRVLYVWSVHHPEAAYCQGMNEILVPFIHVFVYEYLVVHYNYDYSQMQISTSTTDILTEDQYLEIEVDVSGCFRLFMETIENLYVGNQVGNLVHVEHMQFVVQEEDEELFNHMISEQVHFKDFAFQWFHCMFVREFDIHVITRIWDTYLSIHKIGGESLLKYHAYVCALVLLKYSKELKTMKFDEILIFLKNIPTKTWPISEVENVLVRALLLSHIV